MSVTAVRSRIAILAALPREVAPLVRDWPAPVVSRAQATSIWENDRAIVVCAGMGKERVTLALQVAESRGPLRSVVSVGYAGALREGLGIDGVHWPATVIDGQTGERFPCEDGDGILVTSDHIVGRDEKLKLAAQWKADLVDMEAATVAKAAKLRSLPFRTVRAVSDPVGEKLPDLGRFTDQHGGFQSGKFAIYVALHPWLIPTVVRLGNQSARASRAMAAALLQFLRQAE
ncbi:MAG: phosphorylase [Acidobacteriota bacterium]